MVTDEGTAPKMIDPLLMPILRRKMESRRYDIESDTVIWDGKRALDPNMSYEQCSRFLDATFERAGMVPVAQRLWSHPRGELGPYFEALCLAAMLSEALNEIDANDP